MKKLFYFTLLLVSILLLSCNANNVTTIKTTTTKTTVSELGTDGFLLSKEIVVKGNTIWGFSEKVYGNGIHWREIVAMNPFLNEPGRVYYNEAKKMWIVLIYPGEVIKIGNEVVIPTYTVEEKVTTVTTTPTSEKGIPWWGWVLIGLIIFLIVWLIDYYQKNKIRIKEDQPNSNSNSTSNSAVHVNIHEGGIDLATRAALLGREMDFRNRSISIIEESAKRDQVSSFTLEEDSDLFYLTANFKETKVLPKTLVSKKQPVKKDKK